MTLLRQCMTEDMQLRNLAPATQRSYIAHAAAFARFFRQEPGEPRPRGGTGVSALPVKRAQNVAERISTSRRCSSSFSPHSGCLGATPTFRVRRPHHLPVVLSQEEVVQFFDHVPSLKYRAALMTCYGAGLRVSEAAALRSGDIDSKRMLLRVEQARAVMIAWPWGTCYRSLIH